MKLETTITERDKKLLVLLAVLLMIVAFVLLVLMPAIEHNGVLQQEIDLLTEQKAEMDDQILLLPQNQQQLEKLKTDWDVLGETLYGPLKSKDIDCIVTGEVLKAGLNTQNLSITINEDNAKLLSFQSTESEAAATENETQSGVYSATVSLFVEGTPAQTQTLVDRFANDFPAVHITSIAYENKEVLDAAGLVASNRMVLGIVMEFYLCEDSLPETAEQTASAVEPAA